MAEWKEYTVADVVSTIIDYRGKTPKKLGGDWTDSGYRALSAKNIKTGEIVQPDSIRYVSDQIYKKWMKEEIQKEDILITSEAPFGQIYYWNSDEKIVLSQRLFAIRVNKKFYPKYVYFYMTSLFFQSELDGRATGTTVVGLRQPELLKCKIYAPEYSEQVRIADILWCLEQKINNNKQINNHLAPYLCEAQIAAAKRRGQTPCRMDACIQTARYLPEVLTRKLRSGFRVRWQLRSRCLRHQARRTLDEAKGCLL